MPPFYKRGTKMRYRKSKSNKKIASIAAKVYNNLSEKRFHVTNLGALQLTTTGVMSQLNDVSQGDNYYNRDGNEIVMTGMYAQFYINNESTNRHTCRITFLLRHNGYYNTPKITNMYVSLNTPAERGEIMIIHDRYVQLEAKQGKIVRIALNFKKGILAKYAKAYFNDTGFNTCTRNALTCEMRSTNSGTDTQANGTITTYFHK